MELGCVAAGLEEGDCVGAALGVVSGAVPVVGAALDAAFDGGLISFSDEGAILFSSQFAQSDRDALGIHDQLALCRVGGGHLPNLAWHRTYLLDASA